VQVNRKPALRGLNQLVEALGLPQVLLGLLDLAGALGLERGLLELLLALLQQQKLLLLRDEKNLLNVWTREKTTATELNFH
jgi:hypothetical protein